MKGFHGEGKGDARDPTKMDTLSMHLLLWKALRRPNIQNFVDEEIRVIFESGMIQLNRLTWDMLHQYLRERNQEELYEEYADVYMTIYIREVISGDQSL
jgi:hypothetical protein